jgi:hypothetical protein
MKTSWMVRLFPGAWRARYEDEFRALLEDQPASAGDMLDILAAAGDAQLRYRQLPAEALPAGGYSDPGEIARRRAARRVRRLTALYANAALFVVASLALIGINALTTPGDWWAIFPIWGWSMFLFLHAATVLRGRGLLAAHLILFTALNEGLAWIDVSTGGDLWFQWPLGASAVLLIAHALYSFRLTGIFGTHAIIFGLTLALLGATAWVHAEATEALAGVGISWGAVLLGHALMRFFRASLLTAHVLVYLVLGAYLLAQDLRQDDGLWFYYPLLAWGVILAAHFAAERGFVTLFGKDWEQHKRDALVRLAILEGGAEGSEEQLQPVMAARARELRLLYLHAFAFTVGALAGVVLNLLTLSVGPWMLWPLWGWGMLLAAHAGLVFFRHSLLGAHLALTLIVNAGLITIDVVYTGGSWFFWPLGGTALLFLLHLALSRSTLRAIKEWESRRVEAMME